MLVPRSSFYSSDASDVFSTSPSESSPVTLSEHSSRSPRSSNAGTTHPSRTHEMRNLILHGTSRMSNDPDSGVNGAVPHPPSFRPLENEKEPSTSDGREKKGEEGLNETPRTNYFVHPPASSTAGRAKTVIDILLKEEAPENKSDTFHTKENMGDREGKEEFVVEDTKRKKPTRSISLNISDNSSQAAPPLSTTTSVSITITSPTDASSAVTSPKPHSFFSVASSSAPESKSDSTTSPIPIASPRFLRHSSRKVSHRTEEKEADNESEAKQKKVGDVVSVEASTVSPTEAANDSSAEQRSAAVPSALSSSLSEVLTASSKEVDLLESKSSSPRRGKHLHEANSSNTTTTLISVSSHYPSLGSLQNSDVRSSPSTHVVPSEISHLNDHPHRSSTVRSDLLQSVDGLPPPPPAVSLTVVDSTPPLSFPPFPSRRRSREEKKTVEGELLQVDYSGGEDMDIVHHLPPPSTYSPAPPHSTPSLFLLSCSEVEDTVPPFTHEKKEPPPQRLPQENEGNLLLDTRPTTIPSAFDVPSSFDPRSQQEHMTVGSTGNERKRIAGSGGGGEEVITLDTDGKESEGFYPTDGTGGEKKQELSVVVEGRGQENDEMAQKKRKGSLSLRDAREGLSKGKKIGEICHSATQYDDPPHHPPTPSSTILSSRVGYSESNPTDKKDEQTNGRRNSSDRSQESSGSRRSSGRRNDETFLTATPVTTTETHILGNADMPHRRLHDARDGPVSAPKALDEEKVWKASNTLLEVRQEEKGIHSGSGRSSSRNESAKTNHKEEDDCPQKGGNSSANEKLYSENRVVKNSDQTEIKEGSRHSLPLVSSKPFSHSFSLVEKKDTLKTVETTDEESHFSTVTKKPHSSRSSSKKHDASGRKENQHTRKNSGVTSSSSSFRFTSSLSSWKSGFLDIPTGTRSNVDSRTTSSAEKRSSRSRWRNTDTQSQKNPIAQRRLSSLLSSTSQEKSEHSASRTRVRQHSFTPFGKALLVTHSPTTGPLPLEADGDIESVSQAPRRGEQKATKHLAQIIRAQKNDGPADTRGVITACHSSPIPFSGMAAPRHNTLLFFPHPPLKEPLPAVSRGNVKYSRQLLALREKKMALDMRVAMLQKKAALPDAARGDPEKEREKVKKREERQRIKLAQLRGYHGKCERKPSLPEASRGDPEKERKRVAAEEKDGETQKKGGHLHLHLSSAPLPLAARGTPTSYSFYSPPPPPDWDPRDPRNAYFWRDSVMRSQLPNWVNFTVGEQLHEERVLHYGGKYGDSLWDSRPWDPQRRAMYATNDVPPVRYSKSVSARLAQELKRLEAVEVAEAERKDLLELQAQWKIRCGPFHHRSLTGFSFSTTSSLTAGSTSTTKRTTTRHPQSRHCSGGSPTVGSVAASRGGGDHCHAKRRHLESKKDDKKGRKRDRRRARSCPIPTPPKKLHPTDTKALTNIHGVVQRERTNSSPPPPTGTIFTACTQDTTPVGGAWNLREKDEAYPFQKNPYILPALNAYRKAELKSIFQQYQMVAGKTGKRGEEGNLLLLDDAVQEPVSPYRRGATHWEKRKNTSAAGSHHPHRASCTSSSDRRKSNRRHCSAVHPKHKNATAAPCATSTDGVVGGIGGGFSGLGAHTVSPYLDGDRRGYLTFLHPYSPESDSCASIAERRKAGKEKGDEGKSLGRQPSRKRSREGHPHLHLSLKNSSAFIPRQRDWNTRSDNLMEDRLHDPSGSVYSWWAGHTYLTPWEEKGEPPPPPCNPVTSPLPAILETFQASRGGGGGQPRKARHFSKSVRKRSNRAEESKKEKRAGEKNGRKRMKKARLEKATRNHTSKRRKRNNEAKKKEQRNARGKSSVADSVEADDTQEDKAVRRAERSDPRGEGYKMAAKKHKEQLQNPVFYDLYGNRRILTTVQTAANVARLKKKCLRQDRLGYYEEDRSQVHLSMLKSPRPLSLLPSTGVPDPSDVPSMFDTHTLHHVWHHPQLKNISVHKSGVPLDSSYDYLLSRHGFWGQTAEVVVS